MRDSSGRGAGRDAAHPAVIGALTHAALAVVLLTGVIVVLVGLPPTASRAWAPAIVGCYIVVTIAVMSSAVLTGIRRPAARSRLAPALRHISSTNDRADAATR